MHALSRFRWRPGGLVAAVVVCSGLAELLVAQRQQVAGALCYCVVALLLTLDFFVSGERDQWLTRALLLVPLGRLTTFRQPGSPVTLDSLLLQVAPLALIGAALLWEHWNSLPPEPVPPGLVLREQRRASGLLYTDLALRLSIPVRTLAEYELGMRPLSAAMVAAIMRECEAQTSTDVDRSSLGPDDAR